MRRHWSGSTKTHIGSAFHGVIEEIPGVIVDNFENPEQKNARAFFLSHCHLDHIQGLHSVQLLRFLEHSETYIYTTELTAAIIDYEKVNNNIMKYIKVLKKGSTLITLQAQPNTPELYVTVSLLPAGHCAGSTMFLFKTTTHTILFTGDFRINPNDISKYKSLHEKNEVIPISTLYMDTTFLDWKYENFPKRSESVDKLIFEMKKWLNIEDNVVFIRTSARYGYEYVYREIYERLNMKVFVGDQWRFYSTIPHLVTGVTNNEKETRIHLTRKTRDSNKILHVNLSAMKWSNYKCDLTSLNWLSATRLDVCFATHCSRHELIHFVHYLSPGKVIGFPNKWRGDDNSKFGYNKRVKLS